MARKYSVSFMFILLSFLPVICSPAFTPSVNSSTVGELGQFRPVTVIIVRHAEQTLKMGKVQDLTPEGHERAQKLIGLFEQSGIDAIYASTFEWTQLTAKPLAEKLGLIIETFPATDYVRLTRRILSHSGGVVFVVAHSNTFNRIIESLGGSRFPDLGDLEYDKIFIVTVYAPGRASVFTMTYGNS